MPAIEALASELVTLRTLNIWVCSVDINRDVAVRVGTPDLVFINVYFDVFGELLEFLSKFFVIRNKLHYLFIRILLVSVSVGSSDVSDSSVGDVDFEHVLETIFAEEMVS